MEEAGPDAGPGPLVSLCGVNHQILGKERTLENIYLADKEPETQMVT